MSSSRLLDYQEEDAFMEDQKNALEGGKALLRHQLSAAAVKGILIPIGVSRRQITLVETNKRIKKVKKLTADKDKAERIAAT